MKEKELLNAYLKCRVSQEFKKEVIDYCEKTEISVSEFLRELIIEKLKLDEYKKPLEFRE